MTDVIYVVCYRDWNSVTIHKTRSEILEHYISEYLRDLGIDRFEYDTWQKQDDSYITFYEEFISYFDAHYFIVKSQQSESLDLSLIYSTRNHGYDKLKSIRGL
jgi:hypothetical protein